jgi:uncharacterized protein YdiU (UPF0061 family)
MTELKGKAESGWRLENSYARLPELFFSSLDLSPVRRPELIILNHSLAESLGLNVHDLQSKKGVAILAGNQIPDGSLPIAQAYAVSYYV